MNDSASWEFMIFSFLTSRFGELHFHQKSIRLEKFGEDSNGCFFGFARLTIPTIQFRNAAWTLNIPQNEGDLEAQAQSLLQRLGESGKVRYTVFQLEKAPTTGHLHFQVRSYFLNPSVICVAGIHPVSFQGFRYDAEEPDWRPNFTRRSGAWVPLAEQDVLHEGGFESPRSLGDWPSQDGYSQSTLLLDAPSPSRHDSWEDGPDDRSEVSDDLASTPESVNYIPYAPDYHRQDVEDEDNLVLGENGCWEDKASAHFN